MRFQRHDKKPSCIYPHKEYTNVDNVLLFSSTDFIHYISAHTSEPTAVKIKHTLPV